MQMFYYSLCSILIFQSFLSSSHSLTAQLSRVKLPTTLIETSVVYDGNDTIYIFAGFGPYPSYRSRDILEYKISTDQIRLQPSGQFPTGLASGAATTDGLGNYYYFGGFDSNHQPSRSIYRFSSATGEVVYLDEDSVYNVLNTAVGFQFNSTTAFVIGRSPNVITRFDTQTNQLSWGDSLPAVLMRTGLFWDGKDTVYIIGSNQGSGPEHLIIGYDIPSGSAQLLPIDFPEMVATPSTVWDDTFEYGWAIGGFEPTNCIMQLNMGTREIKMIPVDNFPGGGTTMFYNTAAVYIPKLHRIYFFGGKTLERDELVHDNKDDIWFIDLSQAE